MGREELFNIDIEFKGKIIPARHNMPLSEYIETLNLHDPDTELLAATGLHDLFIHGHLVFPPAAIFTDADLSGFVSLPSLESTYLAWVVTDPKPTDEWPASYQKTSEGRHFSHQMVTPLSIYELRKQVRKVPENNVKVVFDSFSFFLRSSERNRNRFSSR